MTARTLSRPLDVWRAVVSTASDGGVTTLRLAAALVIWPHGAQKVLGWFGGHGLQGTLGFMTSMGIPPVMAWMAILAEFVGGIALALGLFTRLAAVGVFGTMLTAMLMVHAKNGFFMNWSGQQAGEGIEYFVYALAVLGVVAWKGGGTWSLDRKLTSLHEGSSSTR